MVSLLLKTRQGFVQFIHTFNDLECILHLQSGRRVVMLSVQTLKLMTSEFNVLHATLNCLLIDSNRLGLIAKNTIESGQIPSSR